MQYWIYRREVRETLDTELQRTQTRGRTVAALVAQELESSLRIVRSIANRATLRRAWDRRDLPGLDEHLSEARTLAPETLFVAVHDLSGLVHRVAPRGADQGLRVDDGGWSRGVMASGQPGVSDVYTTRSRPPRVAVSVAAPLLDAADRPAGLLMAAVDVERLRQRLADAQRSVVGESIVLDQRGRVVVALGFAPATEPAGDAPHPDLAAAGLAGHEEVRQVGSGAERYVASVTPIPSLGWAVLYRRPHAVAFAGTSRLRARLLTSNAYLGLIFLATAGIALHLARRQDALDRAVRQSEERHRLLFDSSPLPLLLFDVETLRFLAVNQAAVRHYGYTREEFLALQVTDIRPPEDVPLFLERMRASTTPYRVGETWRHRTKDGAVIDVEIFSHRLTVGGRAASLVMVNDVSELRRHREELQTLLDSMSTMVATVTPDGRFLQVNRTARVATGLSEAELMATGFLDGPWWAFDPEVRERVGRAFQRACGGVPVSYEEKALLSGQEVAVSFSLRPVAAPGGQVAYVVAEARDVTALKSAEARLQQRSRELEALNQELEAFTYSVSHDLRAPLRAVAGFARILEEDHAQGLDGDGRRHLRRIVEGARQMGNLIDDLLNLSRIGRSPVARQPTDLAALVEEARRKVEPESGGRNIEWRIQALPVLACDARLVGQVFVNLLSNAVKYTRPRDRAVIAVGAEDRGGETVLFVRDNGVGFDMKYAHKLFGVFQRLHDSDSFEGTGVGLATVQRIVHRHGGRLWAEAGVDRGASFYFTLQPDGQGGRPRPSEAANQEASHERSG